MYDFGMLAPCYLQLSTFPNYPSSYLFRGKLPRVTGHHPAKENKKSNGRILPDTARLPATPPENLILAAAINFG